MASLATATPSRPASSCRASSGGRPVGLRKQRVQQDGPVPVGRQPVRHCRARALGAGCTRGPPASEPSLVVDVDAGFLGSCLTASGGLAMVVVRGERLGTLALVWRGSFEPA